MRRPSGDGGTQALPPVAVINKPIVRSVIYQLVLVLALLWLGYEFALNAKANLGARNIASGLGFLDNAAGFGINLSLISYDETDTYGRVFVVGLLNTLLVSGIGIVLATLLGFAVGIGRLSANWLVARICGGYVELIRNLPLLFQILFWYLAVLSALPGPRQSLSIFGEIFLNNRGIVVPALRPTEGMIYVIAAFGLGVLATIAIGIWQKRLRERTGRQFSLLWPGMALIVGAPLAAFLAAGLPIELDVPRIEGFNFVGGARLIPEFIALLVALTTYTASFIAEIVRAGQAIEIIGITMGVYLLISLVTSAIMSFYGWRLGRSLER